MYGLIIDDLEWALENGGLPDALFSMNGYRITKGVVAATLANVQLQKAGFPLEGGAESYTKAADAARIIINSGQYGLIENGNTVEESAFSKMRNSEVENEYIFSVEADELLKSINYSRLSIPKSAGIPGILGDVWIVYRPLDEFLRVYDPSVDIRGAGSPNMVYFG